MLNLLKQIPFTFLIAAVLAANSFACTPAPIVVPKLAVKTRVVTAATNIVIITATPVATSPSTLASTPNDTPTPTNTPLPTIAPTLTREPTLLEKPGLKTIWVSPINTDDSGGTSWSEGWDSINLEGGGTLTVVNDPDLGPAFQSTLGDASGVTERAFMGKWASREIGPNPPWVMRFTLKIKDGFSIDSGGWSSLLSTFNGNKWKNNEPMEDMVNLNFGRNMIPYIDAKESGTDGDTYRAYFGQTRLVPGVKYTIELALDGIGKIYYYLNGNLEASGDIDPAFDVRKLVGLHAGGYGVKAKGVILNGPVEVFAW